MTKGKKKEVRIFMSDAFHREVKAEAARAGKTMRGLVLELLTAWLKERNIEVD